MSNAFEISPSAPIGVFDSGIGGLTVLQSLIRDFPHESFIYIGDTARLPYGTKSPETVRRYAEGLTRQILRKNVKAVVVACSTASTHAIDLVQKLSAPLPALGMIEPTAFEASNATRNGHIGVIATFGTIRSEIYKKSLLALNPHLQISSMACQMLVALAEEGWTEGPIARATLHQYLDPLFDRKDAPDTLILGCTHFPLFIPLLKDILGSTVTLIDSGTSASRALARIMPSRMDSAPSPQLSFYATDDPARFAQNGAKFFGNALDVQNVSVLDIME